MIKLPRSYRKFELKDLPKLEVVSDKVSEKYKIIKTSKFIENTNLPFVSGIRKGAKHICVFGNDNIKGVVENSFDGSLAFRTFFSDGTLNFGFIRQIHKGKDANNIENISKEFINTLKEAANVLPKLKVMIIPESTKKALFNIAFEQRGFKNRLSELDTNFSMFPDNGYDFLVELFTDIREGNFTYTTKKTRKARALKNEFKILKIQAKVWEKMKQLHIEMYF